MLGDILIWLTYLEWNEMLKYVRQMCTGEIEIHQQSLFR